MNTLVQLYDSMTPAGYYTLMAVLAFLAGLIIGWLLWWSKSRRYNELHNAQKSVETDVNRLLSETDQLKREVKQRETLGSGAHAAADWGTAEERELAGRSLSFASATGPSIDWGKMDGVDPKLAGELKSLGIHNVDQLESLSLDDRKVLEAKMKAAGASWDWGWLGGWKTAAAGLAASGAAAAGIASTQNADTDNSNDSAPSKTWFSKSPMRAGSIESPPNAGAASASALGINLPSLDGPRVDWGKVEGVDPKVGAELDALGIGSIDQLEKLSGPDREKLEASFRAKGIDWDWGRLGGWKSALAGGAAAVGGAAWGVGDKLKSAVSGASLEARKAIGISVPDVEGPTVDWGKVEGVDPKVGAELDALGIGSIDQLEKLSGPDREKLEASFRAKGIDWDWGRLGGWKSALAGGAAAAAGGAAAAASGADASSGGGWGITGKLKSAISGFGARKSPGANLPDAEDPKVDWGKVDGVDPKVGAELDALGIGSIEQLEKLSGPERAKLEANFRAKGIDWDWGRLGGWKTALAGGAAAVGAAALGATDKVKATVSDASLDARKAIGITVPDVESPSVDWSKVDGVDSKLGSELDALGISSVDQLEKLSGPDREKLEANFRAKGIDWDWGWLGGWKNSPSKFGAAKVVGFASGHDTNSDSDSALATTQPLSSAFGGSAGAANVSHDPNELPVLAQGIPSVKDDLTLLDGIDGPQAMELHRMGIHNFDQLHDMSAENRMRLQAWFRKRGWYLDMDQWRIASEGNTLNPTIEDIQNKAYDVYSFRDREGLGGGERTDWEQAEWELRGNPSFGYGVPHDVDDFAVSVTGITPDARDELYRMGLYNWHQVQNLDHDARRLLTRWFAGPRFGVDLTASFGWLSSLRTVPKDKNYGFVFDSPPERIDDLSDINGVGHATERELNRIGIYHFYQIACWSQENIDAIAETLELGDRIEKDHWLTQAKRLADQIHE